jgi:hypothetical protein
MRYWMTGQKGYEPMIRLWLLGSDLESLTIALSDFETARAELATRVATLTGRDLSGGPPYPGGDSAWPRLFHHAKVFVVCMRRFARLLEAARSRRTEYPPEIAEAIETSWKASKAFFDQYRTARDAVEHIDGEVRGTNRRYLNLSGNSLEVVDGVRVEISARAVDVPKRAWERIMEAVAKPARTGASAPGYSGRLT